MQTLRPTRPGTPGPCPRMPARQAGAATASAHRACAELDRWLADGNTAARTPPGSPASLAGGGERQTAARWRVKVFGGGMRRVCVAWRIAGLLMVAALALAGLAPSVSRAAPTADAASTTISIDT